MSQVVVIAHNIRSTHNVGSLLRTAEGLGIDTVYFTGYTPYPLQENDERLPHLAQKIHKQITKTSLGAETTQNWQQCAEITSLLTELDAQGYTIAALEQSPASIPLPDFVPPHKLAILLGSEVEGVDQELLARIPLHLEIPMAGKKESFNVVQAAAMVLYHCKLVDKV
jgi:23S rRNA (guanosine2251-2'-O)-methyltransferase